MPVTLELCELCSIKQRTDDLPRAACYGSANRRFRRPWFHPSHKLEGNLRDSPHPSRMGRLDIDVIIFDLEKLLDKIDFRYSDMVYLELTCLASIGSSVKSCNSSVRVIVRFHDVHCFSSTCSPHETVYNFSECPTVVQY